MGYKRKTAKEIVRQMGGCSDIQCDIDGRPSCVCYGIGCGTSGSRGCLEYAKKWLEEHPKKKKIKVGRRYRTIGGIPILVTGKTDKGFTITPLDDDTPRYELIEEEIKEYE